MAVDARSRGDILLRDVQRGDLDVFFEHQLDPDATRMAAFPARDRMAFMAHWRRILDDESVITKTILFRGAVAGNIVSFVQSGEREVGYWIGKEYWGRGVATQALSEFLGYVETRPLYAHVSRHNIASLRVLQRCGFESSGEGPEELILKLEQEVERSKSLMARDEGLFVGPDDGKVLPNPIGGRMMIKIRDGDSGGSYSIHDNVIPAGSPGPLPHLHRDHEETFYVLEGELTVRVGAHRITAPQGSFVVIPRGVVHQPSNPGDQPTRVLLIFSPGGMDRFFEEAAEGRMPLQMVPNDPEVRERLRAFTSKYGYEFAELPPES